MAVAEPCRECGILDALGRHEGTCPRALEMGLPRLADGEDPIDPVEEDFYDQQIAKAREPEPEPDPLLTIARERGAVTDVPDAVHTGLWMAYHQNNLDPSTFDAVIFAAEIDALRYAVNEHWQVMALELGRSLVDQARTNAA